MISVRAAALCALLVGAGAVACDGSAPAGPSVPRAAVAGDIHTDPGGWIEYTIGDAPLIISAPHGGLLTPTFLPNRTCAGCVTGADEGIEELARSVAAQFRARTGLHAHVVISKIARIKLDANREVVEATGGNDVIIPIWRAYHAFLDTAAARVTTAHRRGLLLDLHGTVHPYSRLELGYAVSAETLRLSDDALAASGAVTRSAIARLTTDNRGGVSPVALLRGSTSLGAILARNGYPGIPSPDRPAPAVGELYYDAGYITRAHGSAGGGAVDAIQIEAWRVGVRDTPANINKYAAAIVSSALEYLRVHYGWSPPSAMTAVTELPTPR
jgi:N-formylglutamate amidohydrolase